MFLLFILVKQHVATREGDNITRNDDSLRRTVRRARETAGNKRQQRDKKGNHKNNIKYNIHKCNKNLSFT